MICPDRFIHIEKMNAVQTCFRFMLNSHENSKESAKTCSTCIESGYITRFQENPLNVRLIEN